MFDISEAVVPIAVALEQRSVPYAFGGAVAYAFHAQPRATTDIDINIFVPETESAGVLRALSSIGVVVDIERDEARIRRDGQIRLRWEPFPVDLFFANFVFLVEAGERIQFVPYQGREIPILSAEDLAVCKIAFNRDKDWLDLREMLQIQRERLDLVHIRRWLDHILGSDDARVRRFDALVADVLPKSDRQ